MSYKALYRTYRPSSFEEVVGQQHIVKTLRNAVKQNKTAHAYLFCGPRGTGKTTIAKLLAKAVNCEHQDIAPCGECENCLAIQQGNHPDIVEIDAASNNGVDEVRDLIEKVKYAPLKGKFKVYIIDEVHMMSQGAFNALLKTLEEPPAHVIFILATTEPQKVLPTIISRCQRYDFTKVSENEIVERLKFILEKENVRCDEEALRLIAQIADGGMRDALSIMDQCIAYAQNDITAAHVNEIYGITTVAEKIQMIHWIFDRQAQQLLEKIRTLNENGADIKRLTSDLIEILKECVIYIYTQDKTLLNKINEEEAQSIIKDRTSRDLLALIDILMETVEKYRVATSAASYFEVAVLKMIAEVDRPKVKIVETVRQPSQPVISRPQETVAVSSAHDEPDLTEESSAVDLEIPQTAVHQEKKKPVRTEPLPAPQAEIPPLDYEFVIQLMASADKQTRKQDEEKWKLIGNKCRDRDLNCARIANLLKNGTIRASGERFILICVSYQALANQINDEQQKKDILRFCHECLGLDKHVFAINQEQFNRETADFMERSRNGTLPAPVQLDPVNIESIENTTESDEQEVNVIDNVLEMFGKENVEIIEEETI